MWSPWRPTSHCTVKIQRGENWDKYHYMELTESPENLFPMSSLIPHDALFILTTFPMSYHFTLPQLQTQTQTPAPALLVPFLVKIFGLSLIIRLIGSFKKLRGLSFQSRCNGSQ